MNKNKFVKSLMILVLVLFSTVLLTACGKKQDTYPLGSIDDSVYVSAGTHQVTQKELYQEFRFDGLSILENLIDEKVFAEYYDKVDYDNEDHREVIEEAINNAIYGSKDIETIQKRFKDSDVKDRQVRTFVDSLVVVGKLLPLEKQDLYDELMANDEYENYSDLLLDLYKQKMAVRIFAKEKLDEELKDEDSDQYIKDKDVVTYYKNNRDGKYNVTAFYTEFENLDEQRATFRELSVKISSSGKWFLVPDIRILDSSDENYVDIEDPSNDHIKSILENKKIKYVDESNNRIVIEKEDYETYYNAYSFDENRTGNPDFVLEPEEVLEVMINAHNLLHSEQLYVYSYEDGIIKKLSNDEEVQTVFEYEDFDNSQLRNHIYTSLNLPTEEKPNNVQYSQRASAFGDYAFLAFKFADESESQEGVLNEDKDEFLEGNDDLIAELKEEMAEKKLTDTYVASKINEHNEESKLNIYDPILRALYDRNYGYKGSTKFKDNNTLAEVGDIVITVDEFYAEAEKSFGTSVAGDLLTTKLLKDKYYSEIDKDEHKANEEQMKQMIVAFGQNQYAANGYPASIGRNQFLLLAFRANTIDEAIENSFVQPKLRQLFEKDLEGHYDNIYEKFAELAEKQYENYWSLKASHLLIYLDRDLDGSPDNPNELDEAVLLEAQELLPKFIKEIMDRIAKETSEQKGIERLITDYEGSTRLNSDDEYDKEYIWSEFKRFGFKLKQETLGDITNSTNFLTSSSRLDKVFYERATAIYEIVKDYTTSQFPYLDFFSGDVSFDPADPENQLGHLKKIQTDFGWHLIMATGVDNELPSAKLEERDDESHLSKIEVDGVRLSGVNENDIVNATQIQIYLAELASEYAVQIRVKSALEKQFTPIKTKYDSTQMKTEITYRLLVSAGIEFKDQDNNDKFIEVRNINKLQLFEYQLGKDPAFDALWGDWFEIFK